MPATVWVWLTAIRDEDGRVHTGPQILAPDLAAAQAVAKRTGHRVVGMIVATVEGPHMPPTFAEN